MLILEEDVACHHPPITHLLGCARVKKFLNDRNVGYGIKKPCQLYKAGNVQNKDGFAKSSFNILLLCILTGLFARL
jgi:hypothetical protein